MPTELIAPGTEAPRDPGMYAVAVRDGHDAGRLRVSGRAVQPRIGLLAVLEADRRRGLGTASRVELSPYDLTKGRITYRHRR